jgi:transposase
VGAAGQTTNALEGYFSQLKRTINGTHIWVSEKHLHKYAKESEYRFNRRQTPAAMLPEMLSTYPDLDSE